MTEQDISWLAKAPWWLSVPIVLVPSFIAIGLVSYMVTTQAAALQRMAIATENNTAAIVENTAATKELAIQTKNIADKVGDGFAKQETERQRSLQLELQKCINEAKTLDQKTACWQAFHNETSSEMVAPDDEMAACAVENE